jgi:hypothetical protein
MRVRALGLAAFALLVAPALRQGAQELSGRWVGSQQGRTLTLDFYADTMLVVNDLHALDYETRHDTLYASGDTSFTVRYWFALDRLLLQTENGEVVTMAHQGPLARPLDGEWRGAWDPTRMLRLHLDRGGTAQYRIDPATNWTSGEWDRSSRTIQFTWLPDSTVWTGQYDPGGNALLFDSLPNHGTLFLHRAFRW